MTSRETYYFMFFRMVQGVDDVLDISAKESNRWDYQIEQLRVELDHMVELVVSMAATQSWEFAIRRSGFQDFWDRYEAFTEQSLRPYFR